MKLSELKTGMIVKTRARNMYLVMCTEKGMLFIREEGFNCEYTYEEDLTSRVSTEYDIITVFNIKQPAGFEKLFDYTNLTCLWEREEPIDYNTYVGKICRFWDARHTENTIIISVYKRYDSNDYYPHSSYENCYSRCKLLTQEELKELGINLC